MDPFAFAALIVVCVFVLKVYQAYLRSRGGSRAKVADLEERVATLEGRDGSRGGNLEERVRALEVIVTDSKFQLDRELDRLRDRQDGR